MDEQESPEDAVLREIFEESAVTAQIDGLLGIQNLPSRGWLGIIFLCHHTGGLPVPDGVETDKAGYFSPNEMESFHEPFEPWCEWLARRVLAGQFTVTPCELDNPYHPLRAFL